MRPCVYLKLVRVYIHIVHTKSGGFAMGKGLAVLFLFFFSFNHCNAHEDAWQDRWVSGLQFLEKEQHIEARAMFSMAVDMMSQEEIEKNPGVLMNLAQANYELKTYDESIKDCEKLLTLKSISDQDRLIFGNMIVSALWKIGKENEATDAYMKYIATNTLLPRYNFQKDRIIVSNLPESEAVKKNIKNFYIRKFCNTDRNFHDYGNTWVIDVQKNCGYNCKQEYPNHCAATHRSAETIRACCNTCSTLAVGASAICSSLPSCTVPTTVCKFACIMFVEGARQACEWCCYNGGLGEKCWENFKTWKDDFHSENPECPHPSANN